MISTGLASFAWVYSSGVRVSLNLSTILVPVWIVVQTTSRFRIFITNTSWSLFVLSYLFRTFCFTFTFQKSNYSFTFPHQEAPSSRRCLEITSAPSAWRAYWRWPRRNVRSYRGWTWPYRWRGSQWRTLKGTTSSKYQYTGTDFQCVR